MKRIAIVGGGAAGMMAAATICEQAPVGSYEMHIFEKNSLLGNKVLISGGGRCNVTTGYYKKQDFLGKYIRGADFLQPSLAAFGPRKVYQWFEAHGVPLKIEKDMRVFPVSNNGKDVVGAFEKLFETYGVQVHFKEGVRNLHYRNLDSSAFRQVEDKSPQNDEGEFILITDKGEYTFDMVVVTTGGNAYAYTGSSGEGYDLVKGLGHSITPLGPSLNSFQTPHTWMHELSGLSFPWARLQVTFAGGKTESVDGPVLLTHFGISGPNVFALSALIAFEKISVDQPLDIVLMPEADSSFDIRLQRFTLAAAESSKKEIHTIMRQWFPQRLADAILGQCAIDGTLSMGNLSKELRKKCAQFLSGGWVVQLTMRKPGDEFVTAGGVSRDEINPDTMESLLCPGLYFAGEILDVDGVTGGFNLQACWSTGRAVGMHIGKNPARAG